MGYGIKHPGIWNGKQHFIWQLAEGTMTANIAAAMAAWEAAVGVKFTGTGGANVVADFKVKAKASGSGWDVNNRIISFRDGASMGTALHEIGHLFGLSHEHDRSDSRVAFYEADTKKNGFGLTGAISRAKNLVEYGGYDHESIMQYPESNYITKTAPSAGDIATVKTINGW